MKKIFYLLAASLFYHAASAQGQVQVQQPVNPGKINPVLNKNYKMLSFPDADWEQKTSLSELEQKSIKSITPNPFTCELWITTDGTMHCKTDAVLSKTSVFFLPPSSTSPKDDKGNSTGVGGSYGVQMNFKKALGIDEYTWGITKINWGTVQKYNKLHAIALTAFNEKGQKGIFTLVNKKVPEKIQE